MGTSPYSPPLGFRRTGTMPIAKKPTRAFSTSTVDNLLNNFSYGNPATPMQEQAAATQQATATQQAAAQAQQLRALQQQIYEGMNTRTVPTDQHAASVSSQSNFGGGSTSTTAPTTGDQMDGFAKRYVPGEMDSVWQHPEVVLHDYLSTQSDVPMNVEGDLGRYADSALPLYNLLIGGNMAPGPNANDTIVNWMAKYFDNLSSVGGRTPTVQDMMQQLYAGYGDKTSALGGNLYDADGNPVSTDKQVSEINNMLGLTGTFSNPYYANAMDKQSARMGNEYRDMVVNGKSNGMTYLDYLKANYLR